VSNTARSHFASPETWAPPARRTRSGRMPGGPRRRPARSAPGWAWVPIGVLWLAAAAATAADAPGAHSSERLHKDQRGYAEYQQYCAVCHGVWADGEGLIKPVLTEEPTNLRTLEQRHGSPLPRERIAGYIDGRIPVLAHGSRDMPVWGKRLDEGVHSPVPDQRKRSQVMVIVDYLQAIQDEPQAASKGKPEPTPSPGSKSSR